MINPTLLLFDIEGTLHVAGQPIAGAVDALGSLRQAGYLIRFITNTTTKTAEQLQQQLHHLGFVVEAGELLSAAQLARLAATNLANTYGRPIRIWPVVDQAILPEFAGFAVDETKPDLVIVGDIGDGWTWPLINRVFLALQHGAQLVALHRNKFWQTPDGLHVDIGFLVAGFEAVTGQVAQVMGKPASACFAQILAHAGVDAAQALMVGDDLDSDVLGAQACGLTGVLVKTGKFREEQLVGRAVQPDVILASVADLPAWLAAQQQP